MAKPKYDDNFPLLAEDYARQGMIDKEIAKKLGISEASYYDYQKQHSEFLEAIKRGKRPVDVEVENALLKRAEGYEYEEVHVEFKPGQDDDKAKPKSIKKIKKQVVPDVTAQIFWLKNRRPGRWKDRQHFDLNGNLNIKVVSAVPRSKKKPSRDKSPLGNKDTREKK